jgi:hypothetical protein
MTSVVAATNLTDLVPIEPETSQPATNPAAVYLAGLARPQPTAVLCHEGRVPFSVLKRGLGEMRDENKRTAGLCAKGHF